MPTVTTRRASFRHKLLPPEGHATVATVAGLDPNSRFVDEHFSISSVLGCALDCTHIDNPETRVDLRQLRWLRRIGFFWDNYRSQSDFPTASLINRLLIGLCHLYCKPTNDQKP